MRKVLVKPVQNLLGKLSNIMASVPTELLYIPKNMTGLGLKCPMDIITSSKLAIIYRAQLQSSYAANIAAGILKRPQKHQQPHWGRFKEASYPPPSPRERGTRLLSAELTAASR